MSDKQKHEVKNQRDPRTDAENSVSENIDAHQLTDEELEGIAGGKMKGAESTAKKIAGSP